MVSDERPGADPFEFTKSLLRLAPGGELAASALDVADQVLRATAAQVARMADEVEPRVASRIGTAMAPIVHGPRPQTPAEAYQALLVQASTQSPAQARTAAAMWMLDQLVADEARMLAVLAAGDDHPVVHVDVSGLGTTSERIVANVSSLGRAAGVSAPLLATRFLGHLAEMGLVELGPALDGIDADYEILEAESAVRRAMARYEHKRLARAKAVRQSVHLSDLGRWLWDRITEPAPTPASPADR